MSKLVRTEIRNGVACIILNRGEKKNAFNDDMMNAFGVAISSVVDDPSARAVIIQAEGSVFCSGLDLADANQGDARHKLENVWKPIILSISEAPKPFLACVNGPAIGFGVAIVLACDIVHMAKETFLQMPFVDFGWVPDNGLTWQLTRLLGPKKAIELIASGDRLSGKTCASIGLANHAHDLSELVEHTFNHATKLAAKPPLALAHLKQLISKSQQLALPDLMSEEAASQEFLFTTKDAAEAKQAFMQKRPPVFRSE